MIFSQQEIELSRAVFAEEVKLAKQLGRFCIFGTGKLGQWVRSRFKQDDIGTATFVDNNSQLWGSMIDGVPVMSLEEFSRTAGDTPLVICVVNTDAAKDIAEQCRRMGVMAIPMYKAMAALRIGSFADSMPAEAIENNPSAQAALHIWDDAESLDKYLRFVKFHALRDAAFFVNKEEAQYFNPKYLPQSYLCYLADVGAYDGDTLMHFLELTHGDFGGYYACEPDSEFFAQVTNKVHALPSQIQKKIHLYNMAVGSSQGELRMKKCAASASTLSADGQITVPINSLDNIIGDGPVSLIKMDIEGAEPMALRGAEKIIATQRPALAISVYHQVRHFWDIPLWIWRLNLGYRLRLGCHSNIYNEVICYALPKKA